ncbi:M15 family metallopeptidase [Kineococcus sp. R86509]|uniref:M15 family metallopeptidase n=1 Tax=Kineococcus sp. R86509 TaxID=3093851 RepID=UPI0036D2D5A6
MNVELLMSDPVVAAVPVREDGDPLVVLGPGFGPAGARVRRAVAARLALAQDGLPRGTSLRVVEGLRELSAQRAIIARYSAQVRAAHPDADDDLVHHLTSRFVAPVAVAPHVAGSAVDLTLVDERGRELDLGTPIDATPENSRGACATAAPVGATARRHREVLGDVLLAAGFVNYPTEWWHWSFGDRYWAAVTGAEHALHGPLEEVRS